MNRPKRTGQDISYKKDFPREAKKIRGKKSPSAIQLAAEHPPIEQISLPEVSPSLSPSLQHDFPSDDDINPENVSRPSSEPLAEARPEMVLESTRNEPSPSSGGSEKFVIVDESPDWSVVESKVDPNLGIKLPVRVNFHKRDYIHRSKLFWGCLASVEGRHYICRLCSYTLDPADPTLSSLSHLIGTKYYRKKSSILASKSFNTKMPCPKRSNPITQRAQKYLAELMNPTAPPPSVQLSLPSTSAAATHSEGELSPRFTGQLSWMTEEMVLTKAMVLVSAECLPFSIFESKFFHDFISATIERYKNRKYTPIRSHQVRSHIVNVYNELKTELFKRLENQKGFLHLTLDSCTFNTIKTFYNLVITDGIGDWHVGHAKVEGLRSQNAIELSKLILKNIQIIETLLTPNSSPPQPSALTSSSSVPSTTIWDSLTSETSTYQRDATLLSDGIATIIMDGEPVNRAAIKEVELQRPSIVGLFCCVHGLNLLMKYLVENIAWMMTTLADSKKIIAFFKNRTRPREILKLGYPRQLLMYPETRFCYALMSLRRLEDAAEVLKLFPRAAFCQPSELNSMQKEWIRLETEYKGKDQKKFNSIQTILRDPGFYSRLQSMIKILFPIYTLLRVFDRASPQACGWVFSSLLHLRHTLGELVESEFGKLNTPGIAEAKTLIDIRLHYIADPPVVLAFFLHPPAVAKTPPHLLQGFWHSASADPKAQIEESNNIASSCLFSLFPKATDALKQKVEKEFSDYIRFCKGTPTWDKEVQFAVTSRFPIVSRLMQRLVSSPAVSSASERFFSTTRRIERGDRNRLSNSATEMLSFINLNVKSKVPKMPLQWEDIQNALQSKDHNIDSDLKILEEEQLPEGAPDETETVELFTNEFQLPNLITSDFEMSSPLLPVDIE